MNYKPLTYIIVMALCSYIIRALPITLVKKKIANKFIQSFLYYVPYITLSIMTFPAIIEAVTKPIVGIIGFIIAIILAYFNQSLIKVAIISCTIVYLLQLFIH